jgi:hypothetical protein
MDVQILVGVHVISCVLLVQIRQQDAYSQDHILPICPPPPYFIPNEIQTLLKDGRLCVYSRDHTVYK